MHNAVSILDPTNLQIPNCKAPDPNLRVVYRCVCMLCLPATTSSQFKPIAFLTAGKFATRRRRRGIDADTLTQNARPSPWADRPGRTFRGSPPSRDLPRHKLRRITTIPTDWAGPALRGLRTPSGRTLRYALLPVPRPGQTFYLVNG